MCQGLTAAASLLQMGTGGSLTIAYTNMSSIVIRTEAFEKSKDILRNK